MPAVAASPHGPKAGGGRAEPEARRTGFTAYAVAGIATLAAALAFLELGAKSFWLDEGYSFAFATQSWSDLWEIVSRREINMSLYYALLHLWLNIGTSEAAVRSLSLACFVATVPLLYALGSRLFRPSVGVLASLVFVVNAFAVRHAQEARAYSLVALLVTVSTLFLTRAVMRDSMSYWLAYAVVSGAAVYAHLFAIFVLVAQLASLAFIRRRISAVKLFVSLGVLGLVVTPFALLALTRNQGRTGWLPQPSAEVLWTAVTELTGYGGIALLSVYLALTVVAVTSVGRTIPEDAPYRRWVLALVLGWLLIPILLGFAISYLKPIFFPRYLMVSLPPLALLAALGLAALPRRWLSALSLALLIALSIPGLARWYTDYEFEKDEWRSAARLVLQETRPGDGIIIFPGAARNPFEYYVHERRSGFGRAPEPIYPTPPWGSYATRVHTRRDFPHYLYRRAARFERVWVVVTFQRPHANQWALRVLVDKRRLLGPPRNFKNIAVFLYGEPA